MFKTCGVFLLAMASTIFKSSCDPTCDAAYSCASDTISVADGDWCQCNGYKSCHNSYIEASIINCYGVGACIDTSTLISQNSGVNCGAHGSCVSSADGSKSIEFSCHGKYSCASGVVAYPHCHGEYGCAFGEIHSNRYAGIKHHYGEGALSMYKANIYSDNNNILIQMRGYYAGYGSTIHCESGDYCGVMCYGNACFNMEFNCQNGSICRAYCQNDYYNGKYGDGICPNGFEDNINVSRKLTPQLVNIMDDIVLDLDLDLDLSLFKYDLSVMSQINDNITSEEISDYIEYTMQQRLESCGIIAVDSQELEGLNISIFENNSSICCSSNYGCDKTRIEIKGENSNLYCDGYYGCRFSSIIINNKQGVIYASGRGSVLEANIVFDPIDDSSNYHGGILVCSGEISCYDAEITNAYTIIATGQDGLGHATVYNVSVIYGFGYYACVRSYFENRMNHNLTVYLMAYKSGLFLDILCQGRTNETICTIYCYNDACSTIYAINCTTKGEAQCVIFKFSLVCMYINIFIYLYYCTTSIVCVYVNCL